MSARIVVALILGLLAWGLVCFGSMPWGFLAGLLVCVQVLVMCRAELLEGRRRR